MSSSPRTTGRGRREGPGWRPVGAIGSLSWTLVSPSSAGTVLATQRRLVDHTLATQRDLVGQLLDTAGGVATAAGTRLARTADEQKPARP